jgi:RHS repeat-associated protein
LALGLIVKFNHTADSIALVIIDSSGLSYYGARYLAPWLARWISPDSAGAVDGLNLYVYVGNNPLKYIDPTGHVKVSPADISKRIKRWVRIGFNDYFPITTAI